MQTEKQNHDHKAESQLAQQSCSKRLSLYATRRTMHTSGISEHKQHTRHKALQQLPITACAGRARWNCSSTKSKTLQHVAPGLKRQTENTARHQVPIDHTRVHHWHGRSNACEHEAGLKACCSFLRSQHKKTSRAGNKPCVGSCTAATKKQPHHKRPCTPPASSHLALAQELDQAA